MTAIRLPSGPEAFESDGLAPVRDTPPRDPAWVESPTPEARETKRPANEEGPTIRLADPDEELGKGSRLKGWWPFLATVVIPTLLVAIYFFAVATPQYQSEAHFLVRTNEPAYAPAAGLGAALGLTAQSPAAAESQSIDDYLLSHDAVAALGRRMNLPAAFRPLHADPLSRLWDSHPAPETLLKFYRRQVKLTYNHETGISTLKVRAFTPADAQRMAETLLALGEARVNTFNQRALENSLTVAKQQLAEAEAGVAAAQGSMTGLRQSRRDIDPDRTGAAQIVMATTLQQQLAQARAQLAAMSHSVAPDSPQRVALTRQVQALEAQVGSVQARLAGPRGAVAQDLGAFESLKLRQEFAAKRYETAATALETARELAQKQQLFVVRVVEPDRPVRSLYPERGKIVTIVFFGLLLTYAIGWLILAGVREHAL
jgi:capsular polysaccharide transport system permease protein